MKKKIVLVTLILGVSFTLTACTTKNNSLRSQVADVQNTNSTYDNSEIANNTSSTETTDNNSSAKGGNSDIANYIEVTVLEDKYLYENHEILLDDLIKVFDMLDGNTAVKISDENATLNAYESLTKNLEQRGILFEIAS